MKEGLKIKVADGSFDCYAVLPAATSAPIVVVIQAIFGVNAGIRSIADGYAVTSKRDALPAIHSKEEKS